MTETEYCMQHPEECDEDGFYLYQDKPWEGTAPCDYDPEYAEMLQHQMDRDDFLYTYISYLSKKIEEDFQKLDDDEKDKWILTHQKEYDELKAKYDPSRVMSQPKQPVQNMDPDEIPF